MTYAVLSDVHANLEALQAVLAAARNDGVDRILCLGDLVGYHANPNEVLERLRIEGVHCLSGNHDQVAIGRKEPLRFSRPARRAILWTRQVLSRENRDWLGGLPFFDRGAGPFLMVHAGLHPEPNDDIYLMGDEEIAGNLDRLRRDPEGRRVCFFGHTHQPVIHTWRDGRVTHRSGGTVSLEPDGFHLVNPGSVGQSRDRDPRAAYAIYESGPRRVTFRRVEYDRRACLRKAAAAGLLESSGLLARAGRWILKRAGVTS